MKTLVNLEHWNRKEHFQFFSQFEEPFYGINVQMDCTYAYNKAKKQGVSFFLYYLYQTLKAVNETENFRYRIIGDQVFEYDKVHASPTIMRDDNTFGFGYIEYHEATDIFYAKASKEIERVKNSNRLEAAAREDVIHFSALPWINFTSVSHARSFSFPDSCPKISVGKMTEKSGIRSMPVSVHVHHGLVDGYHVGLFMDRLQDLLHS
ncbi:chloramphenicol acetyltransferase [Fulvivirga sediminis]|uniref:Chloramphenicol acetyltransferase n=1 Tax=Fulvivirga sediminis TaxID=2803949 RepID=A0A937F683_9BACT|nr:chloramphenicol acetyltransferase [Fulvivirga sediminis]MBL3657182.1 chloramphenicol acetyltransferase [Fulvivirga sediminis]